MHNVKGRASVSVRRVSRSGGGGGEDGVGDGRGGGGELGGEQAGTLSIRTDHSVHRSRSL